MLTLNKIHAPTVVTEQFNIRIHVCVSDVVLTSLVSFINCKAASLNIFRLLSASVLTSVALVAYNGFLKYITNSFLYYNTNSINCLHEEQCA